MELDEIKQVSKELEDILEGFPDVPKEPMLQTRKTSLRTKWRQLWILRWMTRNRKQKKTWN